MAASSCFMQMGIAWTLVLLVCVGMNIVKESRGAVICPDGSTKCLDGQTCCKLKSGKFGCCPYTRAVCCADYVHCCPNGYTCDITRNSCNKATNAASRFIQRLTDKAATPLQ